MEKRKPIIIVRANKNGFTLIEALIAISIFSIGFLAIGSLVISTTRNNTKGNILTQATMLASDKIEELKNENMMSSLMTTGIHLDSNNPLDDRGNQGGIYHRSWNVSELQPTASPTARQVEVTVSWDRLGQARRVRLTTITRGNGT